MPGKNTDHFHKFAGRTLLAAMVPLALGIAGDFLVVLRLVSGSLILAIGAAVLFLAFAFGLWEVSRFIEEIIWQE